MGAFDRFQGEAGKDRAGGVRLASRKGRRVVVSENILRLIIEGKVRIVEGKKLKYGKYRVVKRYVVKR